MEDILFFLDFQNFKKMDFFNNSIYDFYYLFLENEIINNQIFSLKISSLIKHTGQKKINVKFIIPEETYHLIQGTDFEIPGNSFKNLNEIFKFSTFENSLFLTDFDFYIYDNTNLWLFYVSQSKDFALMGCDKSVNTFIRNKFKPYEKIDLKTKLQNICWHLDFKDRNEFLKENIYKYFPR